MNQFSSDVLERIGDAFVALDTQWRYTYVNRRAGELFGRSAESLIGKHLWTEHAEAVDQLFAQASRRAMQEQVPVQIEGYYRPRDRWLESRIYPSPDGLSVFLTDVTERKRTEAALRESEQRFRTLVEASPEAIGMVAEGRFAYVNPAAVRLLGAASPDDLLGREALEVVHPDERPRIQDRLRRMRAGEPVGSDVQRWVRLDGTEIQVEVASSPTVFQGRPAHQTIARDITLRVQAEEALRESEERYRLVVRATNDVIWDYDPVADRVYRGDSLASTFGYDPAEERPEIDWWKEHIHPEDLPRVLAGLKAALEGEASTWSDEYRLRRRDGRYAVVYDRGLLRRDDSGRPIRMIGSMQDVTEKRGAEAELRALFAAMQDVIFVMDHEGRYRKIAPTNPGLLLRPSDELIGRTFHEVLPAETADFFLRSVRASLDGSRRVGIEYSLEIEGQERWFAASLSPMTDETVVWVARDITERRRSEEALRASERRYREIFEQSRDPIYLRRVDGTLVDVNPAAEEVFGAPREELLRHNVREFYADPTELAAVQQEMTSEGAMRNREVRLRRLNGSEFDAFVSSTALRSESGEVIGYQGTVHDITERKEAEAALQRSEAWFRSLTQNALDIITVLDAEGRIRYSSPSGARTLGYEDAELRGRALLDLVHPEDQPQAAAALARLVREGTEPITLTARVRARDDSWQAHQVIAQSLLHDPSVRGIVINSRDVTEHRRLEAQLRQAQKMEAVGRLAGGVAHDFNNILMTISGFAALLEAEIEPVPEAAAQYLGEIQKAADRAASLTRQLLAFGRKQALRPKVVNLNAVVEGASSMLRRLIREDLELVHRLDPRLGQCLVDPHQVEQVLMNLVVNAADALPDGGTIEIFTGNRTLTERDRRVHLYLQPGSYATLSVRDNGHGMDAETLAKIFEPFFTTKEVGKGTGLGLSMVYGIVKQSGGYILVDSRPGQGSTFTVLFPRTAAEAAAAGPRPRSSLREGRGTVLLAEDEDAVRLLARLALQKAGYAVLEARDGHEALRIAERHPEPIDLLLTDVVMPHLGGYNLAARLRERWPGLRVVYMSGYEGNAPEGGTFHPGEAEFLAKPITPESLTRRVQQVLSAKGG